jgi:HK97 family phage prohead protease
MNLFELRSEYVNIVEHRRFPYAGIELREVPNGTGGTKLEFDGYACITEASYPMADMFGQYDETIVTGAFARTLAEGPDVAFLVNHEGLSLARTKAGTLRLAEDLIGPGLHSGADLDPRSMAVQELRLAVESGNLDQMSFAFRVFTGGTHWNDDYTERARVRRPPPPCRCLTGDHRTVLPAGTRTARRRASCRRRSGPDDDGDAARGSQPCGRRRRVDRRSAGGSGRCARCPQSRRRRELRTRRR